jgi:predicted ATPase
MPVVCPHCQCPIEQADAAAPEAISCPVCGHTLRRESEQTGPWVAADSLCKSGPVAIGQTISHYSILDKLGGGGMGVVFKAHDTRLGRSVALKFLPQEYAQDPQRLERFQREARTASALNHPHICTIHDMDEYEGQPFLVMELIEGQTLGALALQRLSLPALVPLVGQVAKALAAAHAAGIVHRDIKPANIMVRDDGYAKVVDFGLARTLPSGAAPPEAADVTDPGTLLGTVRYMSPEQARAETAGSASDVFSLGIVLYELATGQHPFPADSQVGILHAILTQPPLRPALLNPDIPAPLEALIQRMLEKDARLRPTAAEVDAALAELSGKGAGLLVGPAIPPIQRHTVGRKKELAALRDGFASAVAGRGLFLCVAGEPGIGKTTLVEDFLADLAAAGRACTLARGRCSERLAGTEAYLPFLEALESLLRGDDGEVMARLMKTVAPTWYAQVVPLAAEDSSFARVLEQAKAASQERLKRELSALLQEVSRLRPLLLFLDDLHWADASTVDLLAYIGSKCAALRLLLVLTYRPTDLLLSKHPFIAVKQDLQARGVCREVALELLSRQDIERYLALEFPEHRIPEEFAALIHAKTEGNPLFMVDLLRHLRDRQVLAQEQGRWVLAQSLPDLQRELPESVRSMIERKIDQLGDADRRLLVAASVQGYEFDAAVVAKALALDAAEVEEQLEGLERVHAFVRLVREHEFPDRTLTLRYRFVHVLYQNALFASLRPTRRASLSAAVAQALLGYYGEKSTAVAAELALLLEAARDFARAADYFLLAAQNAVRIFANQEAVALARRGLELLKTLPDTPERARQELGLHLTLGVPLMDIKGLGGSAVEETYTRAQELCQQLGESRQLFTLLSGLWTFSIVRAADLQTARRLAEQLSDLAQDSQDPVLLVAASWALGNTLGHLGEFTAALQRLEKGIGRYDPRQHQSYAFLSPWDPGVGCRGESARQLWFLGYPDQALERSHDALTLAQELSHPVSQCFALMFVAILHQLRRDGPKALKQTNTLITLCDKHGMLQILEWGKNWQGWALAEQGQVEEGIPQMRACLASQRAIGSEIARPNFLALLAEGLLKAGEVEDGLTVVAEALEVSPRTGDRFYDAELYRLKGELLRTQAGTRSDPGAAAVDAQTLSGTGSSVAEAEDCFRQAITIARLQSAKSWELRAVTSLSRLYHQQGKKEEARQMLAEIYGWFTEGFDTVDLREAKALLQEVS